MTLVKLESQCTTKPPVIRERGCVLVKIGKIALAGEAQGIESWPANQRVTSLIPSQGTCLSCRPGPQ